MKGVFGGKKEETNQAVVHKSEKSLFKESTNP
jgi:hypothetical protein